MINLDVTIELKGKIWSANVDRAVERAYSKIRSRLVDTVKARTPKRTGTLQEGWQTGLGNQQLSIYNLVPYGSFVENGTKYMAPRKMLKRSEKDIIQITTSEITKEVLDELG